MTTLEIAARPRVKLSDIVKILAQNLRSICREKGIKQRELAAALGVHEATVSMWFSAKSAPEIRTLDPLAKFLGVSVPSLFETKAAANAGNPSEVETKNRIEAQVREKIALEIEGIAARLRKPKHAPSKKQ